ncbi:hypothetical protein NQ314_003851 [Rhamnusium bicolor]|uniref:Uncharacterized protein n=1 Tax=Rhamnusium bicolor TaxID=1586634 RepID=A0AAV8ZN64_9CUCU|nr:hypothetical protein NQ314_003851 [Rhamnusium bicolor]
MFFADKVNNAFSIMMLVHITWTSIIISILGIIIIMNPDYSNSFRFTMHLGGWLGILFLICFYGQILINKVSVILITFIIFSRYNSHKSYKLARFCKLGPKEMTESH